MHPDVNDEMTALGPCATKLIKIKMVAILPSIPEFGHIL